MLRAAWYTARMDARELAGIAKHTPEQLFERSYDIRSFALRMTTIEEAIGYPTSIQWCDGKLTVVCECDYDSFLAVAELAHRE